MTRACLERRLARFVMRSSRFDPRFLESASVVALAMTFAAQLMGCTSTPDAAPQSGPAVELIPTSPDAIEACAAELGATYCSESDARAAANSCTRKLAVDVTATCETTTTCLVDYSPTREGSCVAGPTYTSQAQCNKPVADNCAFYRSCLEPAFPCGAEGYALGFGEPLCYLFIDHRAEFTTEGQRWLQGVRTCLQRALAAEIETTPASCDALADTAYASHTTCYTEPGNSFCDLSPADVAALQNLVLPYIDNPRVGAQIRAVLDICNSQNP